MHNPNRIKKSNLLTKVKPSHVYNPKTQRYIKNTHANRTRIEQYTQSRIYHHDYKDIVHVTRNIKLAHNMQNEIVILKNFCSTKRMRSEWNIYQLLKGHPLRFSQGITSFERTHVVKYIKPFNFQCLNEAKKIECFVFLIDSLAILHDLGIVHKNLVLGKTILFDGCNLVISGFDLACLPTQLAVDEWNNWRKEDCKVTMNQIALQLGQYNELTQQYLLSLANLDDYRQALLFLMDPLE